LPFKNNLAKILKPIETVLSMESYDIFLLVLGILMLTFSKWIINFHMKLYVSWGKKMFWLSYIKKPGWLKFYRISFSVMWIVLSLSFIIVSLWRILF